MMKIPIFFFAIIFFYISSAWAMHFNFAALELEPLVYKSQNESLEGVAIDIVNRIMTSLGHTVSIDIYPWPRGVMMIKTGKMDGIIIAHKKKELQEFLDYSEVALIRQPVSFYVNKDSDINFDGDLLQLKEKKIGVVSSISYGQKFDAVRHLLTTSRTRTIESNFMKLKRKRIDLVISSNLAADNTIKKMGMNKEFKKLSPSIQKVDGFIAFSKVKNHTKLRERFDREFKNIIVNKTYANLIAKYGVQK